jgi:hypothetical protein
MAKYIDFIGRGTPARGSHRPGRELPQGQYGQRWFRGNTLDQPKPQTSHKPQPPSRGMYVDVVPRAPQAGQPARPSSPRIQPRPHHVVPTARVQAIDMAVRQPVPISPAPAAAAEILPPKQHRNHTVPTSELAQQTLHPQPSPAIAAAPSAQDEGMPRRRWLEYLQWALILPAAVAVGLAVQSLKLGELAIAAYALFAIIRRIESRWTFVLALIALISVAVSLAFNRSQTTAANFAVYAFLLLALGAIQLGLEQFIQPRSHS